MTNSLRNAGTFLAGLVFGIGLIVSGMTSPDKVLGFLDIFGAWDPSLAFVMGGAVLTAMPLFALAKRRARPVAGGSFDAPPKTPVDGRLLAGAAMFGIGWGLAGICPGPGFVNLAISPVQATIFGVAMVGGLLFSARVLRPFLDATAPQGSAQLSGQGDAEAIPAE